MLKSRLIVLIGLGLFLSQCESAKAPRGAVPKRKEVAMTAFGGWMTLSFWDSTRQTVQGEFIALSKDTVYIMIAGEVDALSKAEVREGRIVFFKTETSNYGIWTALTILLSLSNGYFSIITGPLTFLTGIATTVGEATRINYYEYPTHDWTVLRKFARFPQGIPAGIQMHELKPARYR